MYIRNVTVIVLVIATLICLYGCGDTNTSGTLTLGTVQSNNSVVTAQAQYATDSSSSASTSELANVKITFYWYSVGQTSNTTVNYPPSDAYTDSAGIATSTLTLPNPRSETLSVYVKAVSGGLATGAVMVEVKATP